VRLSVCCLTSEPPGRLAVALEPLRALADEVVLAIDARVDEALLGQYAALCDQLHRVEYVQFERQLAWLLSLCRGDWILHLDGDEVVSAALVRRLPELLERTDVHQYCLRRAWTWPDAGHVLDEEPWSTDYNNRLVRNDGTLRTWGEQHGHVVGAARSIHVEEPLHHLDLVLADEAARADKALRYEAARPLLVADGGGRLNEAFYLPERRATPPATTPVATEDAARLAAAVTASGRVAPVDPGRVELTDAAASGGLVPMHLPPTTYRGRLELVGRPPRMAPAEVRRVLVRCTNDGTEHWPGGDGIRPLIRPGYRFHDPRTGRVDEGPRSPFCVDVAPGETRVAPVTVVAPSAPGRYELEIDLVHEHVRWFDCGVRIEVDVAPRGDPHSPRLHASPIPSSRGWRIPRVLHRVWLGDADVPAEFEHYWATLGALHPGWELRTWGEADLEGLDIGPDARRRARTASELSNLMRYEVLHRHGGVYVDTDVEGRRALDGLLGGIDAFAGLELPGRVGTAVLGGVAGHPAFGRAARLARGTLGLGEHSANANGPYLMTLVCEQEPGVHIFGAERFYPYLWDEPERRDEPFPDAYLVHHWKRSWWAPA
jgi:hypothetical protein